MFLPQMDYKVQKKTFSNRKLYYVFVVLFYINNCFELPLSYD